MFLLKKKKRCLLGLEQKVNMFQHSQHLSTPQHKVHVTWCTDFPAPSPRPSSYRLLVSMPLQPFITKLVGDTRSPDFCAPLQKTLPTFSVWRESTASLEINLADLPCWGNCSFPISVLIAAWGSRCLFGWRRHRARHRLIRAVGITDL